MGGPFFRFRFLENINVVPEIRR